MRKVLIVKSVFCPNNDFYDVSINSLLSLFDFLTSIKSSSCEFYLYVVGWSRKEFLERINNILLLNIDTFSNIFKELWFINYGKYRILNSIIDISNDYDNIFYLDHDITLSFNNYFNKDFFNEMDDVFDNKIQNKSIGLLALNQLKDIRHQYDIYQNSMQINNLTVVYPDMCNFTSIACGCFYTRGKIFNSIKRFKLYTVYGLDDYYLLKYMYNVNYLTVVLQNVHVVHPFNNNSKYSTWKRNKITSIIEKKSNNDNSKYFKDIQESINFWNTINTTL